MSTRSDEAALASTGAAARGLRLPTLRSEVARQAEIAGRDRQSYLVFLAELLAAEVATVPNVAGLTTSPTRNSRDLNDSRSSTSMPSKPSNQPFGRQWHRCATAR